MPGHSFSYNVYQVHNKHVFESGNEYSRTYQQGAILVCGNDYSRTYQQGAISVCGNEFSTNYQRGQYYFFQNLNKEIFSCHFLLLAWV